MILGRDRDFQKCHGVSLFRKFFQRVENSFGAWIDADRRTIAPEDQSILVDDEQRAFAVTILSAVGSVFLGDSTFGLEVGQQWEMQPTILRKGCVTPRSVY